MKSVKSYHNSGGKTPTDGENIEPSNVRRVRQTGTLAVPLAIRESRKIPSQGAHFYNAHEEQSHRQPPHVCNAVKILCCQCQVFVPNDNCFCMCRAKYRLHTVAVGPTGVKFSSTGSTSPSNTPKEFSSYTLVERTLIAIGSRRKLAEGLYSIGTKLTDANIHCHDVEYPISEV